MAQPPPLSSALDFSGKVIVVTGGGRGIGAGIARRFGEAGAAVAVNYARDRQPAEATAAAVRQAGGEGMAIQADVSRGAGVQHLVAASLERWGHIDILVNNAGIYPLASILAMAENEWEEMLAANLKSVHLCTQAVARHVVERGGGGAVVNVTSIEAHAPAPDHSHYSAAKAGVAMYTRSAALELGGHGIRVNAVAPGLIHREGIEEAWPAGVESWRARAPLGRLGTPEDVADACLFLASPLARWITGAVLTVDGGMLSAPAF